MVPPFLLLCRESPFYFPSFPSVLLLLLLLFLFLLFLLPHQQATDQ
jgi:hypothetical protein